MRMALLFLAVVSLATPAFAQLALTDTCTGQPTGTSTDMGPLLIIPGVPANSLDNLDTTGTSCSNLSGFDAVTCFVVESGCTSSFTFSPPLASTAFVTINVVIQPGTGSCSDAPPACDGGAISANPGDSATTASVDIEAGSLVCLYTASTVADEGTLLSSGTFADCGRLPVEVQSFTVESSEEAPTR